MKTSGQNLLRLLLLFHCGEVIKMALETQRHFTAMGENTFLIANKLMQN